MNQENEKKSPRKIITQPFDFSVQDLVDKIKNKDINLAPDYQRNYTWGTNDSTNKRSLLIESLLLNIPIPVIYFAETKTLNYEVIDGQQRLQTFCDFMDNKFSLRNLAIRNELNEKKYSELSTQDQNQIRKRSIRAILILEDSDEKLKYEVFERLNLGSVHLTKQEVRNATLRGNFNDLLKKLASNELFRSRLQLRLKQDTDNMAYEEMVLRFFAYHESKLKRATDLATFLTDYMRGKQNCDENEIKKLEDLFLKTLEKVDEYLGGDAFTTSIFKTKKTTNRVLYDAEMLAFASLIDGSEKRNPINSSKFKENLSKFFKSDNKISKDFTDQAGGKKIQERVNQIKDILFQK
jgi:hypothetical protein